jgi:hypothetical protein
MDTYACIYDSHGVNLLDKVIKVISRGDVVACLTSLRLLLKQHGGKLRRYFLERWPLRLIMVPAAREQVVKRFRPAKDDNNRIF